MNNANTQRYLSDYDYDPNYDYDPDLGCYCVYLKGESDHRVEIPYITSYMGHEPDKPTADKELVERIDSLIEILNKIKSEHV